MQEQVKLLDKISKENLNIFSTISKKNDPNESCALILSDYSFYICKNTAENPKKNFVIDSIDYIKASKKLNIIGVIHSHCSKNNFFTIVDKKASESLKLNYLLYNTQSDNFFEYIPNGYRNDYLNRTFEWGYRDCLTLVSDYYKKELNIDLSDVFPERKNNFFFENRSFFNEKKYLQLIESKGFTILNPKEELQFNDVIYMITNDNHSFPNHVAIYLEGDKILHQLRKQPSCIDTLTPELKSRIQCIIRHKMFL